MATGFTIQETVNIDRKISVGVVDAASSSMWFDAQIANIPSVFNKNVLTQFDLIPTASTKAIAQNNAVLNPTLISDLSQNASAIRMVAVTGTNGSTYLATSTYTAGQYGESIRLRNWINPTRVPLASGAPSVGYAIRLFQGNPAAGGTEILPATGSGGTGVTLSPAWIFNYDQGILLISDDYKATLTNPYILGFRYIGKTLTESLAATGASQTEVDTIEAAVGLNINGTYIVPSTSTYLSSSTSIANAISLLDTAIASKGNLPVLALVATTGSYSDLVNKPALFSGSYSDLTDKPLLFSGDYNNLLNKPTIPTQVNSDWNATVGLSVILNKPVLFSGSYLDLSNRPTFPTVVSAFTNDSGYLDNTDILGKADVAYVDSKVTTLQNADAALSARIDALSTKTSLEGIFILDVTPTSTGIVGAKTYPITNPANKVVLTCATDTANVRVTVGIDGSALSYSPTVTIAGVNATVTESSTIRWFTAVADITIGAGTTVVTAVSNTGANTSVAITLAGVGPAILSATIGAYPNAQTALKAGDQITITVTTESTATELQLLASGASAVSRSFSIVNSQAICVLTIGATNGAQVFTFKAKNAFGTYGNNYSTLSLNLDQIIPSFGALSVTYPNSKGALNVGDTAIVTCAVSNITSVSYTASGLTVDTPTTYISNKTVSLSSSGYVDSGTNYSITAFKASNGSSNIKYGLVNIATTAPTAAITTSPTGRMVGSPTGVDYTVTITSTQNLSNAPTLNASAGTWIGNWSGSNKVWTRSLRIYDSTSKGSAVFNALTLLNQGLVAGSNITSGDTYVVGGFVSKTLTFPAFSRVTAIGTSVLDQTKTSCQIVGGNVLTRYTDNAIYSNGYYIANSDGTYNATGSYLGLSDSVFAGANTSGTLQVTLVEES